jgi:hypothetical protein
LSPMCLIMMRGVLSIVSPSYQLIPSFTDGSKTRGGTVAFTEEGAHQTITWRMS